MAVFGKFAYLYKFILCGPKMCDFNMFYEVYK